MGWWATETSAQVNHPLAPSLTKEGNYIEHSHSPWQAEGS
jgi:hypothetical protein